MTDHWRIVWDKSTNGLWTYKLQRKKKFLWWSYWSLHTSSDKIEWLKYQRNKQLEREKNIFKVVKEWK